ncbi:MAG TPA: hypothetical protein VMR14_08875 [Streptosporangiaceae bacterium]|nr:hypothetical protein [Streptosporangiaceae bacterium]
MPPIPTFSEYLDSLGPLTTHSDPTSATPETIEIKTAAANLIALPDVTADALTLWAAEHPESVNVLGLAVGLSQEKLKNFLKHTLGTSGWIKLARERPGELIGMLDSEFDLVRLIGAQRVVTYDFGDILVARAGTRQTATAAGASGRKVEDEIEAIARDLGLPYQTRTRFTGRDHRTAPCDLVIPAGTNAEIAVAAKGFDSTGSKLTDAVREIEEMADVRQARQFIMVVVDGIGWKNRLNDLRRIYTLWESKQIDGMYTISTLSSFRADLRQAARLRDLLPMR